MTFMLSLAAGALWGLANAWCLARAVRCVVEGKRGWPHHLPLPPKAGQTEGLIGPKDRSQVVGWKLAGWVALKLVGLYGLAAWMLIGLRLPAAAWLAGFTLSLGLLVLKMKRLVARND